MRAFRVLFVVATTVVAVALASCATGLTSEDPGNPSSREDAGGKSDGTVKGDGAGQSSDSAADSAIPTDSASDTSALDSEAEGSSSDADAALDATGDAGAIDASTGTDAAPPIDSSAPIDANVFDAAGIDVNVADVVIPDVYVPPGSVACDYGANNGGNLALYLGECVVFQSSEPICADGCPLGTCCGVICMNSDNLPVCLPK